MNRSPAEAAQAQLEAYNAKDLRRFLDVFADDVREVLDRMVVGSIVVDHERISGIRAEPVEGVAVYEVVDGQIRSVWLHSDE